MSPPRLSLVVLALVGLFTATAPTAAAETYDPAYEPTPTSRPSSKRSDRASHDDRGRDNLDGRWRVAGGIGARFGSFLVDNAGTGTAIPGHLDAGLRKGRHWLYAEYSLMSLTLPDDERIARGIISAGNGRGLVHRVGANARWSFGRSGARDVGVDLFLEGGLGVQVFRWDAGGVWTRPDLALGIGAMTWGAGESRHGGLATGLRIHLSRRDDAGLGRVACGGPCDVATRPTSIDRSFLFDLTILFGR